MTLIGPRRKTGAFYKRRPQVRRPRRRRYAPKTFKDGIHSSRNYANLSGVLMPNVLFTKLRYARQISSITLAPNSYQSLAIGGSNLAPIGLDVSAGLFPASSVGTLTPTTGSRLWSGVNGYALWYEKMNILSNSMEVKVWSDSTGGASTNANLQVVLSAYSLRAQVFDAPPDGLDSQLTSDIMEQKGVKSRMISGSGGKNYCKIHMNRATKTMLGMVNVSDDFTTSCGLQKDLLNTGISPISNPNVEAQWYYYFRVYNPNDIQIDCTYSISMQANVKFSQLAFAKPSVAATGAPPV